MSNPLVSSSSNSGVSLQQTVGTRRFRRFRLRHLKVLSALLIPSALGLSTHALSQDNWNAGGANTYWDNPLNWALGVPTSSTDAVNSIFDPITVENGGTFNTFVSNGAVTVTGGTFSGGQSGSASTVAVSSTFSVNGGGLSNLTVNPGLGAQGVAFANNGSNSISNVIFNSSVDFFTDSGAYTRVYNANTLNSILTMGTGNGLQLQDGNASLTVGKSGTIQGYGTIYQVFGGATLTNNGTINANSLGKTLTISLDNFTNNNLTQATNGASILLNSNVNVTNNSALTAGTGSTIDIQSRNFVGGSGSTLNQQGTGVIKVDGAALSGTLAVTGPTGLTFLNNGSNYVTGATLTGNLDFASDSGAYARLFGANTFNNGVLTMGTSNGLQLQDGNASLTIGNAGTLQGYGTIYQVFGGATLTNNGTINANNSLGNALNINLDNFTNNNLTEATNGGVLNLASNVNVTNTSALTAGTGSTIDIQSRNFVGGSGSTLNQQGTGVIKVDGAALSGTLAVTGPTGLTFLNNGSNYVTGATLTGNLDFASDSGAYARLFGANTINNGVLTMGTGNGVQLQDGNASLTVGSGGTLQGYGTIYQVFGGATLTNNGTINANNSLGNALNINLDNFTNNNLTQATNGASILLNSNVNVTNNSALTAGTGSTIDIQSRNFVGGSGSTLNQQGTGVIKVDGAALSGTLAVTGPTGLTFLNNGSNYVTGATLTGNLDFASDSGAYARLFGANTFNNGVLTMGTGNGVQLQDGNASLTVGSGGTVQGYGTINQVFGGATLTNNGTINANSSGNTLTISTDSFTNGGKVTVAAGSILTVSPTFNQTGGNTNADGTLNAHGGLNINGGTLTGTGTVNGNVTVSSGGETSPGHSPGTLTINGNYHQTSTGLMLEELGGGAPGAYDVLAVSNMVTLDSGATLDISLVDGFDPTLGETFNILTYGSATGTFVIDSLNSGFTYSYQDNGAGIGVLTVTALGTPAASTPEPGTVALLMAGITTTLVVRCRRRRK